MIDLDDKQSTVTNGQEQAESDSDCILERFEPGTTPDNKIDRVPHQQKYSCYVCLESFEMQNSFVLHFQEKHPNDVYKCEFCQ